ncbi:hypothetical protein [Candidatus Nitrosocosmicus hydrocola]|uniref:hypothetical protein n=1 Tax=Candidatus Nitrosocosmicus hydrocola TaxID=1826872 RepID=UPI0011E59ED4|nr:hypothetical protein [Candidatus Nitrosocosmicus hydrocola]
MSSAFDEYLSDGKGKDKPVEKTRYFERPDIILRVPITGALSKIFKSIQLTNKFELKIRTNKNTIKSKISYNDSKNVIVID